MNIGLRALHQNRPPGSAYARIHDDHVNRFRREIPVSLRNQVGALGISNGCTSWLMSTICASGQMPRITPFITPAKWSFVPKSVVSVRIGFRMRVAKLKGVGALFLLRLQCDDADC